MDTKGSATPHKNFRCHSGVEPDTSSLSIVQQPKSSRLICTENLDSLNRVNVLDSESILYMIKEQIQVNFQSVLQEEIEKGNISLLENLDLLTKKIRRQEKEIENVKHDLQEERGCRKALEQKIVKLETYSRDNLLFFGLVEEKGRH